MPIPLRLHLFAIFLFISILTQANEPVLHIPGQGRYPLTRVITFNDTLTTLHDTGFIMQPNPGSQTINLGFFSGHAAWGGTLVINKNNRPAIWMLQFAYPFYDTLVIRLRVNYNPAKTIYLGDHFPFKRRLFDHHDFIVPIRLDPGDTLRFQALISSCGEATSLPVVLSDSLSFSEYELDRHKALGIYYGIVILALIMSIFIMIMMNERAQYYYHFYLANLFLFQFALDGFGFRYLYPENTWIANHIIPFTGSFSLGFLLLFSKRFLKTSEHSRSLSNAAILLSLLLFLFGILGLCPNPWYKWSLISANVLAIPANLLLLMMAIHSRIKKVKGSGYFIAGFSLLISGVVLALLKNIGVLPRNVLTEYSILGGSAVEVIMLSFAIAANLRTYKTEKEKAQTQLLLELTEKVNIQEEAKRMLEQKVEERTREIKLQKELIEEKNKDITDSIQYSLRIQQAIHHNQDDMRAIFPKSFVWLQPRDIISGDFFWILQKNQFVFMAVADCTGHGVPGALMSMIGAGFLNEILNEHDLEDTGDILDMLRLKIINAMRPQDYTIKDGMDIALVRINKATRSAQYSGAFNPLWIIRKATFPPPNAGTLSLQNEQHHFYVFSADRFPVGIFTEGHGGSFATKEFQLEEGDQIYLSSDGLQDQFGGLHGKKLKANGLQNILLENASLHPEEQLSLLQSSYYVWKANEPQVDDISIAAIKI